MKLHEIFSDSSSTDVQIPDKWNFKSGKFRAMKVPFGHGETISIVFDPHDSLDSKFVSVEFSRGESYDITNQGEAIKIFNIVLAICSKYIGEVNPDFITFSSNEPSRTKLYRTMVKRLAQKFRYKQVEFSEIPEKLQRDVFYDGESQIFILQREMT